MRPILRTVFLATTLVLLAGCGGTDQNSTGSAPSLKAAVQIKSASTAVGFLGARSNYAITRTATGFTVVDYIGAGGTTTVDGSAGTLKFSDLTVNLSIGDKAASISPADLKTLTELYIAYFNRVPDADGLGYWVDQFKAGQSLEDIGRSFYDAAVQFSSLTGYTATMTNADFVKVIYKNVLGRSTVDQGGLNYWTSKIADGTETRGTLVKTILASAHTFKGDPTYGSVADLLDNKGKLANYFAVQQGLGYNTAADSITKGIAIAAAVTPTSTVAASKLINVSDPKFDLKPDCLAPSVLKNGVCALPAGALISPNLVYRLSVAPQANSYVAMLCYGSDLNCTDLNDPIIVTAQDYIDSKGEITANLALADKVLKAFRDMIGKMYSAKNVPSPSQLASIFKKAIGDGIQAVSANTAITEAAAALAAAGFPEAGGGSSTAGGGTSGNGTVSNSGTSTAAGSDVCGLADYKGPNDDPQVDSFCKLAYNYSCLDKAAGQSNNASNIVKTCKVLDGTLKFTGPGTASQYCSYCR